MKSGDIYCLMDATKRAVETITKQELNNYLQYYNSYGNVWLFKGNSLDKLNMNKVNVNNV